MARRPGGRPWSRAAANSPTSARSCSTRRSAPTSSVVAAPILDDLQKTVIGAVTVLLRRDTLFHSIADVTIGSTGHAMLFTSDGTPVICPILAPEEHSVKPEFINVLGTLKSGWTVAADDSHGSKDSLLGFAPVRFSQPLAAGSIGGKHWVTVVRQDPKETFAPLSDLVAQGPAVWARGPSRALGNGSFGSAMDRPADSIATRRRAGNRQRPAWSGGWNSRPAMKSRTWPMPSIKWLRIFSGLSGRSNSGWGKSGPSKRNIAI